MWLFCYFNFERNYDVLKSQRPRILLNKNINFNKNERELKIENSTASFREMNLVLQFIWESHIKSKTVMSWSSRKNKEGIFCTDYFVWRKFFWHLCLILMNSALNTLSEYTYFYITKSTTSCTFFLVFKIRRKP